MGYECLFLKPRMFTFINISAFYELLGYCHRRPFVLHGIFIGVGTRGHLVSAPAIHLICLVRSPGNSWGATSQRFLSLWLPPPQTHSGFHPHVYAEWKVQAQPLWTTEVTKMSETWFSLSEKSDLAMGTDANQCDRRPCRRVSEQQSFLVCPGEWNSWRGHTLDLCCATLYLGRWERM